MTQPSPLQTRFKVLRKITDALSEVAVVEQPGILQMAADLLGVPAAASPAGERTTPPPPAQQGALPQGATPESALSPKQFIAQKQPQTIAERVACLAYYLTHCRKMRLFKTKDIETLNEEAAEEKFTNVGAAVANATVSSKFLAPAADGAKQISGLGEAVVKALPDREDVKSATKRYARARSRRGRPKKNAKKKVS